MRWSSLACAERDIGDALDALSDQILMHAEQRVRAGVSDVQPPRWMGRSGGSDHRDGSAASTPRRCSTSSGATDYLVSRRQRAAGVCPAVWFGMNSILIVDERQYLLTRSSVERNAPRRITRRLNTLNQIST